MADDAHRYTDLDQLVDYVTRLNGGHPVKLVIATRPSGNERVDEALSHQSDEFLVTGRTIKAAVESIALHLAWWDEWCTR